MVLCTPMYNCMKLESQLVYFKVIRKFMHEWESHYLKAVESKIEATFEEAWN